MKLRARATGELMSKSLNLEATLKKATFINGKLTPATSPTDSGSTDSTDPNDAPPVINP